MSQLTIGIYKTNNSRKEEGKENSRQEEMGKSTKVRRGGAIGNTNRLKPITYTQFEDNER